MLYVYNNDINKGIPDSLRGEIWDVLCRVKPLKREHAKGRYQQLCVTAHRNALKNNKDGNIYNRNGNGPFEVIERDLGRTFPRHAMFYSGNEDGQISSSSSLSSSSSSSARNSTDNEPIGIARLRRLLRAYAIYDPEIGYCQGMSFFCAMFLIYRPPSKNRKNNNEIDEGEERAFWQLVSVMHRPVNGIRALYASDMRQCQLCLHTFQELCVMHLPAIARHIENEGLVFSMFATSWYMTIFSSSFPFDLVTRVWDAFLAEGFKIIHRVALSLLKCFSDIILSLGFEELISFLQHDLPNQVDPDYIMSEAFKIPLKKVQIESIAEQYNIQFPEKKNKNSNNSTKGSAAASR